jgi:hypothetical protein
MGDLVWDFEVSTQSQLQQSNLTGLMIVHICNNFVILKINNYSYLYSTSKRIYENWKYLFNT